VLLERPAVEQEYRDENGDPNKASREAKGAAEEEGHRRAYARPDASATVIARLET
jgi:hypothetical protein